MKLSALIAPLVAAQAPHDQIMAVVLAYEAEQGNALERRRQADAERQSRKRERDAKSRDITLRHRDRSLTGGGVTRVEDKLLTSEIEPQEQKERNALTREFALFWTAFPNKVGKPKALASFTAARKRAPLESILAGLDRYIAGKPADRAWLNPTTFLNQDRWADEPAPQARGSPARSNPLADRFGQMAERMRGAHNGDDDSRPASGVVLHLPAAARGH